MSGLRARTDDAHMSVLLVTDHSRTDNGFHAAVRGRRLRSLREQIASGEYTVDELALSEAILRRVRFSASLLAELKGKARRAAA
jgi:anti-sigma28 factor (negative regulator of flagellin synthesis)